MNQQRRGIRRVSLRRLYERMAWHSPEKFKALCVDHGVMSESWAVEKCRDWIAFGVVCLCMKITKGRAFCVSTNVEPVRTARRSRKAAK